MPRSSLPLAALLATLALALLAASPKDAEKAQPGGDQVFALDLYKQLAAANPGKNLFFSPHSIRSVLAMTAEGARGETALQMGAALRFPDSARNKGKDLVPWQTKAVHADIAATNERLSRKNDGYEWSAANALWVDRSTRVLNGYFDAITPHYGGAIYGVDFRKDPEAGRKQINTWTKESTRDRIAEALAKGTVDEYTRLVLTNAVYFEGKWAEAFAAKETKDGDFALADGKKVSVRMMRRKELAAGRYAAFTGEGKYFKTPESTFSDDQKKYPDDKGFVLLELPYEGDEVSMVVILPRSADGLPAVEKSLTAEALAGWVANLKKRTVDVSVPKFEMATTYDLQRPLETMGMKRAFREPVGKEGAEFQGISDREKLFLSRALHKASVRVSEEGTKAAAVSSAEVATPRSIGKPFTPVFEAKRPFFFLIRERKTGAVLFAGRVTDPRKG